MIRSVERACGLLTAFTAAEPRLTLSELSGRVGLPKPTTHRLASTLVEAGFMTQHPDGRYGLGLRLIEVGSVARADLDLIGLCGPAMEHLAERTGETVLLGVVDWSTLEITIVHRIDSAHELSVVSRVGRRSALAPGAIGKALLMGVEAEQLESVIARVDLSAHTDLTIADRSVLLDEISRCRELGYATDVGEFIAGVSAVATPVWVGGAGGVDGVRAGGVIGPAAAVAVIGPSTRIDQRMAAVGASVRDALVSLARRN